MIKQIAGDMNLYSPNRLGKSPRAKTGFANATIAKQTLKNIAKMPITYQKQVVITMYNRAKFHPHRTKSMQSAMKVYRQWMNKYLSMNKNRGNTLKKTK